MLDFFFLQQGQWGTALEPVLAAGLLAAGLHYSKAPVGNSWLPLCAYLEEPLYRVGYMRCGLPSAAGPSR
jgi:hypothetical protein